MINVYLSEDFELVKSKLPADCIMFPENGKNAKQIQEFIQGLSNESVFTGSLYLVREFYLSKKEITWHNLDAASGEFSVSNNVDNVGRIELLERELEQSDRYMQQELLDSKQ